MTLNGSITGHPFARNHVKVPFSVTHLSDRGTFVIIFHLQLEKYAN